MGKRIERWLEKGYTKDQIETHLRFERERNKKYRAQAKKNNEKNTKKIDEIKSDLLGKTFGKDTILSINPSNDGVGFWFKTHKVFKDGSEGDFRYFHHFDDYIFRDFVEQLKYY